MQKSIVFIGVITLFIVIIACAAFGSYYLINYSNENNSHIEPNQQTEPTSLTWHTDLNSSLIEAKQTNKPIFIDFYTNWCSYCKQLDETTLSDPQVQEKLIKNYVAAKIDADKYPDVASQYKIYGYPTLLFLDSNGNEIKRIEGYIDSNYLLNEL